jgi:ribosomal protein S18 acetylase RimI-like enzyme
MTQALVLTRPATFADLEALLLLYRENDALHAALQPGFFRAAGGPARSERALRQALSRRDEALFVACADAGLGSESGPRPPAGWPPGGVCGLIHLSVYDTPVAPSLVPARRAHVADLIVAAWARRRGHGRRLMERATAWARERGATQVLLTVWTGNEGAAAFYRGLGYQAVNQVLCATLR